MDCWGGTSGRESSEHKAGLSNVSDDENDDEDDTDDKDEDDSVLEWFLYSRICVVFSFNIQSLLRRLSLSTLG